MSVATGRECICKIFHSAVKRPQIHRSMYDVPSNTSTARFSTIPYHARACRSPIHMCRNMGPYTGPACLVAVLNGGSSTDLTCEPRFSARNDLLRRFRPTPVCNSIATVRCVPALMPTEIRTRHYGFWKNVESAIQSSRLPQLLLSSISSPELVLFAGASCFVKGCSNDSLSSIFDV